MSAASTTKKKAVAAVNRAGALLVYPIKNEPDPPSLWTALQVVSALRVLTAPFLPFSAQRLHELLGDAGSVHALPWHPRELPAGRSLLPPTPLFRKLDDDELAALVDRLAPASAPTGEPT